MRKSAAIWFVMAIALWCEPRLAQAQGKTEAAAQGESAKPSEEKQIKANQHEKLIQPYRLDFFFNEPDNGERINSRHYAINFSGGSADVVKIGTRLPISTGLTKPSPTQFQYFDLWKSIWGGLTDVR